MVKSRRPIHANKILETIEAERIRKIHEKKLRLIMTRKKGAQIDNAAPKAMKMKHVRLNLKKRKMQKERLEYVESRNKRTMEKLMVIMDRPNPYEFDEPPRTAKSMNINARRKRLMKINEENKHILRRLQAVEPVLSYRRLEDEYTEMDKQRRRLRQHVPTIDIYVKSKSNENRGASSVKANSDEYVGIPKPSIPKGKKKFKGRGPKPRSNGRIIHDSVLDKRSKGLGKTERKPPTKKSLRKVFNMIGKSKQYVKKRVLINEIQTGAAVQQELQGCPSLHLLLKTETYKHALLVMDTDKEDALTFSELESFVKKLQDDDRKQTQLLELVFHEINQSSDDVSDIAKKTFIKAVMRNSTVQALLHSDAALTVLLKPRRYAKALIAIDTDNDGSVSLEELKSFANDLHEQGLIDAERKAKESKGDAPIGSTTVGDNGAMNLGTAQKVELRIGKRVSSADGAMSTYVLCLAYVDPLEEKDSSSKDFAIHVEGYDICNGRHYHTDGIVPRRDFDTDGTECIKKLLNDKLHFEKQISTVDSSNLSIGNTEWVMVM